MSPGNENVVTCHGAFYKRRSKNAASYASASSPIDIVTEDDDSRYPKYSKLIEFDSVVLVISRLLLFCNFNGFFQEFITSFFYTLDCL